MFSLKTRLTTSLAISSLAVLPSLAQAGSSLTFTYSAAGATPVPTTPGMLMIALGLLLAVVAIRTIRSSKPAQRLLSFTVLACGLAVGGMGVDTTSAGRAIQVVIPDVGSPCNGGTALVSNPFHGGGILVGNNCEADLRIESAAAPGACLSTNIVIPDEIIPAGGTAVAPYCPSAP